MTTPNGTATIANCNVCAAVRERSDVYGRFLARENYNDGATLSRVAPARGFCSPHARKLIDADPVAAQFVARWVLHYAGGAAAREQQSRSGYQGALRPSAPCPWCDVEREALELALSRVQDEENICPAHARNFYELQRTGSALPRSLQPPCVPIDSGPVAFDIVSTWWSPAVDALWADLRFGCSICAASERARTKRVQFLLPGPSGDAHWDIPVLCVVHDQELGCPRSDAFLSRAPDEVEPCAVCRVEWRAQARAADLALIALGSDAFRDAYAGVEGFCLYHINAIVKGCAVRTLRESIVALAQARIGALLWQLDEQGDLSAFALRDQRQEIDDAALARRAWCFISGTVSRPYENKS